MIKCPFCGFENEDGALFCEQCKSDLAGVPSTTPSAGPIDAAPIDAFPIDAGPIEAAPMEATPIDAAPVDPGFGDFSAAPIDATPIDAAPIDAPPLAQDSYTAEPVADVPFTQDAPQAAPIPSAEPPAASKPPPVPQAAPIEAVPPTGAPAEAAPVAGGAFGAGTAPKLVVIRGLKLNVEFPLYGGDNFIGRADEQPVDVDLEDQEPPDRVWCSRQHALIQRDESTGSMVLEDLNSSNGTFLNRERIHPGQPKELKPEDVIQIGTVQLKIKL